MRNVSETWRALAATGTARLETVAVIGGREYAAISAPVIRRGLTQDGLGVGNAVAASCQLSVLSPDAIPRAAEVVVRMRLTDGETASEWLDAGTFYVSHRERDAVTGLVALECYDGMLKANTVFPEEGAWPRSMAQVAADIAQALGVEMDARTEIRTGDDYRILALKPGSTIRDVLGDIASVHGGNWVLTPENRLRLVPLAAADAANAVEVTGVLGGVSAGAAQVVTGIRATGLDEEQLIGTEDGLVIDIASPYATEDALAWLAGRLIGVRYQPFSLTGAIYDPAMELGDSLRSKADVTSVLYSETATLALAFRGDIAAPEPEELADEYPYVGTADRLKQLRGQVETLEKTKADGADVAAAEARANAVTAALDAALNQQDVFNRLTGGGAAQGIYLKDGKLYINGSYIDTGTLNADLIRTGVISDASGKNYWILDGNNSEFVTRKGVIGDFTLDNGALQYGSQAVGHTGAYIGKNGVSYNLTGGDDNLMKTEMFAQGLRFYWNNDLRTMLYIHTSGLHMRCYDEEGTVSYPFQVFHSVNQKMLALDAPTRCFQTMQVDYKLTTIRDTEVQGSLTVKGSKNRLVETEDYAERLMYCYETPTPMFGDVGEGVIAEDGRCYVWLDPVFAQTVADGRYQVFLQAYGSGDCRVSERRPGCFIVEGTPGLRFGWELKGRQRDLDQRRLDAPIEQAQGTDSDFGAMALAHIEQIYEGRMQA